MALSLTFPLPALQSGAIASLAKWWPYAQLATRRGKWFIRQELASSHLLPSPMLAQCLRQAFRSRQRWVWTFWAVGSSATSYDASCDAPCVLRSLYHDGLSGSVLQQPSGRMLQQGGMTQHRQCESVMVYLSQVDVDGVLQELRSLSGPLLNGQHAHSFHTGLQLNDSCIFILRHNKERCHGHCLLDTCKLQQSKGMVGGWVFFH